MYKWSEVYRALKPFIRPFGDSGEGRLDFYHRSLSKAIRKKLVPSSQNATFLSHYSLAKLKAHFHDSSARLSIVSFSVEFGREQEARLM